MSHPSISDATARQDASGLREDFDALARHLARRRIDIEAMVKAAQAFAVAAPTWAVGTGGTRFGRFPGPGEPRHVFDKLEDCAVINDLTRATPTVSPHFPWDKVSDYRELKDKASSLGLGFDIVNSNTFQNQSGQDFSYKFGSLSHTDKAVREAAVAHNIECLEIGAMLGSRGLDIWIADGSNFPGQSDLTKAFDRYLDSAKKIVSKLPQGMTAYLEYKFYEPAFYSTVINDWGTSYAASLELGPHTMVLVDLGHHAPNANVEQVVARLVRFQKLGGFHFNDSKYGDDDLDSGSLNPFELFLIFNELVDAKARKAPGFDPAYMIDQSHNVTDPIESLMQSAMEIERAYVQALLVDRTALAQAQDANDALGAHRLLKQAYVTDVSPILAEARRRSGGAIDPIAAYRASGYRAAKAAERPAVAPSSGGIV